ncbi:unnamed protein product, partial [Iphiclides podalirius]
MLAASRETFGGPSRLTVCHERPSIAHSYRAPRLLTELVVTRDTRPQIPRYGPVFALRVVGEGTECIYSFCCRIRRGCRALCECQTQARSGFNVADSDASANPRFVVGAVVKVIEGCDVGFSGYSSSSDLDSNTPCAQPDWWNGIQKRFFPLERRFVSGAHMSRWGQIMEPRSLSHRRTHRGQVTLVDRPATWTVMPCDFRWSQVQSFWTSASMALTLETTAATRTPNYEPSFGSYNVNHELEFIRE